MKVRVHTASEVIDSELTGDATHGALASLLASEFSLAAGDYRIILGNMVRDDVKAETPLSAVAADADVHVILTSSGIDKVPGAGDLRRKRPATGQVSGDDILRTIEAKAAVEAQAEVYPSFEKKIAALLRVDRAQSGIASDAEADAVRAALADVRFVLGPVDESIEIKDGVSDRFVGVVARLGDAAVRYGSQRNITAMVHRESYLAFRSSASEPIVRGVAGSRTLKGTYHPDNRAGWDVLCAFGEQVRRDAKKFASEDLGRLRTAIARPWAAVLSDTTLAKLVCAVGDMSEVADDFEDVEWTERVTGPIPAAEAFLRAYE
eukprot:TRINITY_DN69040_c0_g1_i1.p1 TRINITY_DN69040_c0_g1~~TRINITY_DN69040_c0_g1_i1.p1  ORF type:complete len:320 (-),score=69.73 TRINITY_DN69040_c0_g1_i1:211-1170(-)